MAAQVWDEIDLEPGVAFEPCGIAPRRVRQGVNRRCVGAPRRDSVCDRAGFQMPFLGIATDQECELDIGQRVQHLGPPCVGANGWGWQVGAFGCGAGKAKRHRDNCDTACVIELIAGEAHPVAQAIPGWIIKRQARGVYPRTRRLACDQNPSRSLGADDGAWLVGGVRCFKTLRAKSAACDII